MKALLIGVTLAAALASNALAYAPAPLGLNVYPMCESDRGFLWEVESTGSGVLDVSTSSVFTRKGGRSFAIYVRMGDNFFWTRFAPVYVRDRANATNVIAATESGDRC